MSPKPLGDRKGVRDFDPGRDSRDVHRIWREVGWIDRDQEELMDIFLGSTSTALVGTIDDSAETLCIASPGTMRLFDTDLSMSAVTGVTTSMLGRRQGLALRTTAELVAREADLGLALSGLGMFEQGYYNLLGFGTCGYEHWMRLDPSHLQVPGNRPERLPVRLSLDDAGEIHECRLSRMKRHGSCCLLAPETTKAEMRWGKNPIGLGFRDEDGVLTHHFWMCSRDPEHGPFHVQWMVYRNREQLLELLWLISNLREQVDLVEMGEPPGVQLQDLVSQPIKTWRLSRKMKLDQGALAIAYFQFRMLDLPACVSVTRLPGVKDLSFNLALNDPITALLEERGGWMGVAGEYVVTLGEESSVRHGSKEGLPCLRTTVNAFTRLWMGTLKASSLAVTDRLEAPLELLERLDQAFASVPSPRPDWDF